MAAQVPELNEDQLLDRYGPLVWEALCSFTMDPSYLATMAESANLIEYRRDLWSARSEAVALADTPEQVKELTEQIMASRASVRRS